MTPEVLMFQVFTFQAREKALHRCVVVTISMPRHALHHLILGELIAKCLARILGGFKRSLQHFNNGGCDDKKKTAGRSFRTGQVTLARSANGRTCAAAAVLGRDCGRAYERGSGRGYSGIGAGGGAMVSGGWRYATIASRSIDATAVRAISVVRRARADRAVSRQRPWGSPDRAPAGARGLNDLARVAAQCRHP
jgi:hypothetical protein